MKIMLNMNSGISKNSVSSELMDDSETDKKIYKALALLHSTEESSGQKLRFLLDFLIQEKFGPQKTITSRFSKAFLRNVESCLCHDFTRIDEIKNILPEIKNSPNESDDSEETDDVPRISIPDEGSGESSDCLEEGSKLATFIILECQNCSEIYQPLGNQPPIDIDVFNPELTWLCEKCSKNSNQGRQNLKICSNGRRIYEKSRITFQSRKRKMEDT